MRELAAFILGAALGAAISPSLGISKPKVVTRVDTVAYALPPVRDTVLVEKRAARLPAIHTHDTVIVEVPITQAHYADTAFEAWISGYEPRLDSLRLCIPVPQPPRPKHWHIGATAGCGLTPRGAEPYVGIGITYSFFSF